MGGRWTSVVSVALAAAAFLVGVGATAQAEPPLAATLLAAGDIAGCTWDADEATAQILDANPTGTVAALGDTVYDSGTAQEYMDCYQPTWGRHKARARPAPGNHEYRTAGASGYYGYFGAAAGDPAKGYYSYELGAWHVVVLNSECWAVGGCGPGSPQEQWLQADLATNESACTLAYWHHPRFSSGYHGPNTTYTALWKTLYLDGAELVLSGHEHSYERFAPQDPDGQYDAQYGIRQFVVGTGGAPTRPVEDFQPNIEVRRTGVHGVLKLTLHPARYDWTFLPVAGQTFEESGTGTCHYAPGEQPPPPPPPQDPPPPPPPPQDPPPPPPPPRDPPPPPLDPPPPPLDPPPPSRVIGGLPEPPVPPVRLACFVPRLTGRTLPAARTALRRANCRLGRVRQVRSRAKRGRIVAAVGVRRPPPARRDANQRLS